MDVYEKTINLSHTESSTDLLGPFNRFVIWVHGCCFDCPGCLADNTRRGEYIQKNLEVLRREILAADVEGITISGGEPFLQAGTLYELIREIRLYRDLGVICYSGFTLDELHKRKDAKDLLSQLDILIDGKYVQELDNGQPYVGSSNQTIHYLSDRYKDIGPKYYSAPRRRAEIRFTEKQAILVGVPSKEALGIWKRIKEKAGGLVYDFGD